MQVRATGFPGLWLIEPAVFRDERGFFLESFSREAFAAEGLPTDFVQDNHACSRAAGVLRGFHFQRPPFTQAKLVWVVRGAVLDAALDLRRSSPTFGRCFTVELSAGNFLRLCIPKGFAHAYLTLAPETEFLYKVNAPYTPALEGGIAWNDPDLGLAWPLADPLLSAKDRALPRLRDFESPFVFEG